MNVGANLAPVPVTSSGEAPAERSCYVRPVSRSFGIHRFLRRLRWRLGCIHGTRALLAASGTSASVFAVASAMVGPVASAAQSALALALAVVAGLLAGSFFLRPLRGVRGPAVTRWLEPRLASATRSAVELEGSRADHDLVMAHAQRVESLLAGVPPHRVVPWQGMLDRHFALATAALFVALSSIAFVDAASAGAFALLHPGARAEGVSLADVVAGSTAQITYPAYMQRPRETLDDTRHLSLPVGSTVDLRMAPRFRLRAATLRVPGQTAPLSEDAGLWSGRFVVRESGALELEVRDESGTALRDATGRVLDAVVDEPPTVELDALGDTGTVELAQPIPLDFSARDDLGLGVVELIVQTPAGVSLRRELARFDEAALQHEGLTRITAAEVGARAGDTLTVWIEAADRDDVSGPNIGRSEALVITVASETTRREALVRDLGEIVDLGLDALADRLETAVEEETLGPRYARVAASTLAYAGALAALTVTDAPGLDESVLRDLHRKVQRRARAEARVHQTPSLRKARTEDEAMVTLLEQQVLFLADLLSQVRLDDAAAIARELEALRREMTSLLAELRRTDSAEARQALLAALARAQARMQELAARLAAMGEDAPGEFLNRESIPREAAEDALGQLREAVERGDLDAAERHLLELERQIGQLARSLGGASEEHAESRFGPRERAMAEAIDRLMGLETEQRQLAQRSENVRRGAAERAMESAGQSAEQAARRLSGRAREAADAIASLPSGALGPMDREAHDETRQRLLDTADALEAGDLGEARRMAAEAQIDAERLARDLELSSMMFPGREGETAEAAQAARRAAREIDELGRALDDAIPDVSDFMESAEREQLRQDSSTQGRAREAAEGLGQLFEEEPDGAPLSPDGAESMRRATEAMENAQQSLQRGDPLSAGRSQQEAARELTELREKLEQQRQQEQDEGGGGGEGGESEPRDRVQIPGANEREGSGMRRALLDAMRRGAPPGYEEAAARYYEELLR